MVSGYGAISQKLSSRVFFLSALKALFSKRLIIITSLVVVHPVCCMLCWISRLQFTNKRFILVAYKPIVICKSTMVQV